MTETAEAETDTEPAREGGAKPTWRRNLRILTTAQFLAVTGMGIVLPFIPFFVRELGVTDRAAVERWSGLIFSGPFLAAGLLSPVWGHFGDRYGHRMMVVRAIVALAVVNFALVLVQTPLQFWLLRLVQGAVTGFVPATLAITSASTPAVHLAAAMATLHSSAAAGRLVGPAIGGLLAGFLPFREIFVITGVLISLGAFLVIRYLEEPPRAVQEKRSAAANFRFILGDGPLRFGLIGLLVAMAAHSMVLPIFPLYVEDLVRGAHDASVWTGIGFAVVAGFTMIAAGFVGRIAERHGLKTVLFVSLVITALALAAHPLAHGLHTMLASRALLGIGVAGVQPALYAMINRRAPGGTAGAIQGYASSAAILGFFFGPFFGGWLANRVSVSGVFYIAASVAFACALVTAVVAKRRGRDRKIVAVPDPLPR